MPTLKYRIVNVFTRDGDPLSGNPLCVFEDGESLDTRTMQRLARQFNLSETTFILRSARASARIRIFTPSYEMPFAGHPTLGSAYVCRALHLCSDHATLEMQAGVVPVHALGTRWTLQAAAPSWRPSGIPAQQLADMLGLAPHDLDEPALWVKSGKEQLIVPIRTEAAVRAAKPVAARFAAVVSDEGHSMAYVFARLSADRILGRFFFPQGSAILEDPATGSAAANLGGWILATQHSLPRDLEISQGEQVERPSRLFLHIDADRQIFVGGDVIELGRGAIDF